jgi:DNA mismatch endonuclease, patch repair protein
MFRVISRRGVRSPLLRGAFPSFGVEHAVGRHSNPAQVILAIQSELGTVRQRLRWGPMDIVSRATRSRMMSGIRGRDTAPERRVRSVAHRLGYRFRLHRSDLPGKPDLVFPARRKIIFVHGCYWHRHPGCQYCYEPKSNVAFWTRKFSGNVSRDARVLGQLTAAGWDPMVVWECETFDTSRLETRIIEHLGARQVS